MTSETEDALDRRLSHRIRALVAQLDGAPRLDAETLAAALAGPVSFDDVRAFVRFDRDAYARVLVYRGERFELRLLCWRPGQCSSLHGHGDAACAFRIVRGVAEEIVLGERDRAWPPGAVVEEVGLRVHQVRNPGPDPLITLHAYSPPLPVNAPSARSGRSVVIVGGGLAGAALAHHLLQVGGPELRIEVVERGPWLGRGVAYGVESESFRLNVPACGMSLEPEDPDDYVRFLGLSDRYAFTSRAAYGRYVAARLADSIRASPAKLRVYRDEAIAATEDHVELRDGRLEADTIVLATGLSVGSSEWSPRVIDAWDECGLATLSRDARILVVGSGLSALDVIAWLDAHRFVGHALMVSRRGLLPHPHTPEPPGPPLPTEAIEEAPTELRPLIRWVRERIEATDPWQHGADALRPHVARLYAGLSPADRRRFLVHLRPYWDVFRHRAPADALARVFDWERAGRLERCAARVAATRETSGAVHVTLQHRDGRATSHEVDAIVRCTGPRQSAEDSALWRSLLARGLARRDPVGIGVETDATGRIVDAAGRPSERLFGLGWVERASRWETTAAPDIISRARQLARRIATADAASRAVMRHGLP